MRSSMCVLPEPRDMCSCAIDPISHPFDLHAFLTSLSSPLAAPSPCPFQPSKHLLPTLIPLDRRLAFQSQDTALISPPNRNGRQPWIAHQTPRPTPETRSPDVIRSTRHPLPLADRHTVWTL